MKLTWIGSVAAGLLLSLSLALPALAEMATLLGSPGSRINLRSQPSTSAPAPSYGLAGDRVQILDQVRGNDGFTWYYVEFPRSRARGWIRGDLVALDSAGNTSQRVAFARGATSATVSGRVRGYQTRDYLLNARAGQRMTVTLNSSSTFVQFTVLTPRGETLSVGDRWSGNLPSNGDYIVRVGLVRAEAQRDGSATYRVEIGIR